jgi:glycosyltransferase involved in cell wall biosynthesis
MTLNLTCLLTFHNEGLLGLKTLKSIARSRKFAAERGLAIEVIAVGDKIDHDTLNALQTKLGQTLLDRLIFTDFGDPGLARNAGVNEAKGQYIAMLDGDDLISENWLFRAVSPCQYQQNWIVHPEVTVAFGADGTITYHIDQQDPDFDYSNLFFENYWTSLCLAHKQVFEMTPYVEASADSGFTKIGIGHARRPPEDIFIRWRETPHTLFD